MLLFGTAARYLLAFINSSVSFLLLIILSTILEGGSAVL